MNRVALVFAAGVIALTSAAVGFAATPGDRARGSGTAGPCIVEGPLIGICLVERDFRFSAFTTPPGAVHGTYSDRVAGGARARGRVTCLEVDGNTAVFGGVLTGSDPALEGIRFNVWVVDNGDPGSTPPDLISPVLIDVDDPTFVLCGTTVSPVGYLAVTDGDLTVTDGSAP